MYQKGRPNQGYGNGKILQFNRSVRIPRLHVVHVILVYRDYDYVTLNMTVRVKTDISMTSSCLVVNKLDRNEPHINDRERHGAERPFLRIGHGGKSKLFTQRSWAIIECKARSISSQDEFFSFTAEIVNKFVHDIVEYILLYYTDNFSCIILEIFFPFLLQHGTWILRFQDPARNLL